MRKATRLLLLVERQSLRYLHGTSYPLAQELYGPTRLIYRPAVATNDRVIHLPRRWGKPEAAKAGPAACPLYPRPFAVCVLPCKEANGAQANSYCSSSHSHLENLQQHSSRGNQLKMKINKNTYLVLSSRSRSLPLTFSPLGKKKSG